ncbi:hypothetical protein LR48_Vigan11g063300 [Vigna angularis]|uniref:Uncharacterized protein n=1 Tax=Phaseolus angularis TaxID=3914 RepID=A0A0L9VRA8_PHAAN|nr:hypothetical protein LR48_Vigan11g063300 [Vigna angularis]
MALSGVRVRIGAQGQLRGQASMVRLDEVALGAPEKGAQENSQTRLALARALIGLKASRSKKSLCVKPTTEEVEHVVALMLLP